MRDGVERLKELEGCLDEETLINVTIGNQQLSNCAVQNRKMYRLNIIKDLDWCKTNIQHQTDLKRVLFL